MSYSNFYYNSKETQKFTLTYIDLDVLPELRAFVKELGGTIKHIPIRNNLNAVKGNVTLSGISWCELGPKCSKFRDFCKEKYINIQN
jgi:hypothetical protein